MINNSISLLLQLRYYFTLWAMVDDIFGIFDIQKYRYTVIR